MTFGGKNMKSGREEEGKCKRKCKKGREKGKMGKEIDKRGRKKVK
jgi:hypothetical protein